MIEASIAQFTSCSFCSGPWMCQRCAGETSQGRFPSTWAHTLLPTGFKRSGAGVPACWDWLRRG